MKEKGTCMDTNVLSSPTFEGTMKKQQTILILEEHAAIGELLTYSLDIGGYVHLVTRQDMRSGRANQHIDLVILDSNCSLMWWRIIEEQEKQPALIVLTCPCHAPHVEPFGYLLHKPFHVHTLLKTVELALQSRASGDKEKTEVFDEGPFQIIWNRLHGATKFTMI
jgi:DNA-binding response OmpR family regulator